MFCNTSRLIPILALAASPALAQQPSAPASMPAPAPAPTAAAQPAARPPQRPQVQSPVVQGDKTTFAIYAPKATEVKLSSGEIDRAVPGPGKTFTKDDNGLWTLIVAALPPGIYEYPSSSTASHGRPVEPERRRQCQGCARDGGSARPGRPAAS